MTDLPTTPATAPDLSCALCGSCRQDTVIAAAADYLTGDRFDIRRCTDCGLVRTELGPSRYSLHRYYGPTYYGAEYGKLRPFIERFLSWRSRLWARRVTRRWSVRSVLDVGCGRGDLLRAFHTLEVEAVGLEAADAPHWMLTGSTAGIRILPTADHGPWPVPDTTADLVIFRHTLEHFPDPVAALREARRAIRPDGRLVVVVPNWDSLQRRLTGPDWLHLDVPRHCFHFDAASLRRLFAAAGFRLDAIRAGELHQDLYGWPQSLANVLLRGSPNALYRLLQGGPAWATCPAPATALLQAGLGGVSTPLWILLYLAARLSGRDAVLTAVCRPVSPPSSVTT